MKKIFIFVLILTAIININFARGNSVSFFSPNSLYFYGEIGSIGINPVNAYDYEYKEWAFTSIYGVGYTVLDFKNKFRLNFEFEIDKTDYSLYDEYGFYKQEIDFYNYKLSFEHRTGMRMSGFIALGITNIKYRENEFYYANTINALILEIGIKYALSRKLFLRGELKYIFDSDDSFDYNHYYSDNEYYLSAAMSMGVELRF